jgi:hypothetical protein
LINLENVITQSLTRIKRAVIIVIFVAQLAI